MNRIRSVPSLAYCRRIFSAYLLGGKSHLTFWHETPSENPNANPGKLGEYYMLFAEKAVHRGRYDGSGVPQLDYHGRIGLQYNPIAIAPYGLGNYNAWRRTADPERKKKFFLIADWLVSHLESNAKGIVSLESPLQLGLSRHAQGTVVFGVGTRAGNLSPGARPYRIRRRALPSRSAHRLRKFPEPD
jgi:hypothetical protein